MKYIDILNLKYPPGLAIKITGDTYESIMWNQFSAAIPTKIELDAAIASYVQAENVTNVTAASATTSVIQLITGSTGRMSGTSRMPANALPTTSDGSKIWSTMVTPAGTASRIEYIESFLIDTSSNAKTVVLGLFRNDVCIYVGSVLVTTSGRAENITMSYIDVPNTTMPVEYSLRVGSTSSGTTWYINSAVYGAAGNSCRSFKEFI